MEEPEVYHPLGCVTAAFNKHDSIVTYTSLIVYNLNKITRH